MPERIPFSLEKGSSGKTRVTAQSTMLAFLNRNQIGDVLKLLESATLDKTNTTNTKLYRGAAMNNQDKASELRQWSMILHFSLLSGVIIPYGGLIVPIVIWQVKKEELPGIDAHGKMIANWIISTLIYSVIAGVLCFVFIGFLLFPIIAGVSVVFPIIGGIKANEGTLWKYPLTLDIIK